MAGTTGSKICFFSARTAIRRPTTSPVVTSSEFGRPASRRAPFLVASSRTCGCRSGESPSETDGVRLRGVSRRLVALHATVAVAGALGACGDDDEREGATATTGTGTATGEEPQQEPTGEAVATVDMSLVDFELDPADPEVDEAGVIEF